MVSSSFRRMLQVDDDLTVDGISDEGDILPASTAPTPRATPRRTTRPRQTRTPPPTTSVQTTSPSPTIKTTSVAPPATPSPTTEDPSTPRPTTLPPTTTPTTSTAPVTTTTTPTTTPSPPATTSTVLPTTTRAVTTTVAPTTTATSPPTTTFMTTPLPTRLAYTLAPRPEAEDTAWESISPVPTTLSPGYETEMHEPPTPHTTAFPASAIVAIVAGVLAVLVTAGVVAYYRRRHRQMSLLYLRNMQSTAWTFDDTTVDNDSHAPSGPPRSPSMSIWTNPNRPASEFSSGAKSHWQRHAVPSPTSAADYQTRRARLPSLQTEVNHEALRHNGWYHASTAGDAARVSKPAAPWHHGAPGSSMESLSRLDPAQRMYMSRQGHNLVYDTHQASYVSTNEPECNSAISFKSSGGGSTPRPTTKRSTRGENHLSMSSWDDP